MSVLETQRGAIKEQIREASVVLEQLMNAPDLQENIDASILRVRRIDSNEVPTLLCPIEGSIDREGTVITQGISLEHLPRRRPSLVDPSASPLAQGIISHLVNNRLLGNEQ